jgi:hypothetical protein
MKTLSVSGEARKLSVFIYPSGLSSISFANSLARTLYSFYSRMVPAFDILFSIFISIKFIF